jgi:3-hydroxyisobutyrate dehydrogenase-like beta-hydroxyacid dehydrogenase
MGEEMPASDIRRVGFIGLGEIGLPAATNLIKSGFEVVGFSLTNMDRFAEAGGKAASSAADVAQKCDVIVNCLPIAAALESAAYGPEGILKTLRNGAVLIELSSYLLKDKERLRDAIKAAGGELMDCEITSRYAGKSVTAREALILVSGDPETAKRIDPVLKGITDESVYLGGFGTSLTVKTVNNALVGIHIVAAAEAMAFGMKAGIDPKILYRVLSTGAAGSAQLTNLGVRMAERKWDREFSGQIYVFEKYLKLSEELAAKVDASTPMRDVMSAYVRKTIAAGHKEHDVSSVFATLFAERFGKAT